MTGGRITTWALVAVLAAAPVASTGCRSMRPITPATTGAQPTWNVRPGDDLHLTLTDGRTVTCTVAAVESGAIVTEDGARYPFTEIRDVERREFSGGKTVALIGGGVAGVLVAFAILVAAAMTSLMSGG